MSFNIHKTIFSAMHKSIGQINERIRDGSARVVTAEEMPRIVDELGEEGALKEVDVVTTGTFGAMCSSGAFLNFGHSEPPIRMERIWLNDVEAYGGLAAVDTYIGATQQSDTLDERYGGAHVIEDLVSGKSVELRRPPGVPTATRAGQFRPNCSSKTSTRRSCATRGMPTSGTMQRPIPPTVSCIPTWERSFPIPATSPSRARGSLNPISNDPKLRLIGGGVPIFLCGAQGMVVGEGTQHWPAALAR